jgi:hypothetical protein
MTWGAVAVAGATVLTGYMSQQQQMQAQQAANQANIGMSKAEIRERGRQFDLGREDLYTAGARQEDVDRQLVERFQQLRGENVGRLDPYSQAGQAASQQRAGMLGLGTAQEQAAAERKFSESPGQRFLRERAEKSILRTAAARGGLGGGNVQTALQEQAMGMAATDRENYLRQLGAVSGEGMQASGQIIGMGQGPQVGTTTMYGDKLSQLEADKAAQAQAAADAAAKAEEERKKRLAAQTTTMNRETGPGGGVGYGGGGGGELPRIKQDKLWHTK